MENPSYVATALSRECLRTSSDGEQCGRDGVDRKAVSTSNISGDHKVHQSPVSSHSFLEKTHSIGSSLAATDIVISDDEEDHNHPHEPGGNQYQHHHNHHHHHHHYSNKAAHRGDDLELPKVGNDFDLPPATGVDVGGGNGRLVMSEAIITHPPVQLFDHPKLETLSSAPLGDLESGKNGEVVSGVANPTTGGGGTGGGTGPDGGGKSKLKQTFLRAKLKLRTNPVTAPLFPPSGPTATFLTLGLSATAIFLVARTVFGPIAGPGGTLFALLVLILTALVGGRIVKYLGKVLRHYSGIDIRLPPLLGMLIVGILLKNVPYNFGQFGRAECYKNNTAGDFVDSLHDLETSLIRHRRDVAPDGPFSPLVDQPQIDVKLKNVDLAFPAHHIRHQAYNSPSRVIRSLSSSGGGKPGSGHGHQISAADELANSCKKRYFGHDLDPLISITLRSVCLTVILLMAGLELDPVALWRLSGMVVRATFIPCFVEALAAGIFSHFILGFPWTVGLMFGFVLAAVSPAVIIPSLMSLSERGYGVEKGIPTLVIAACSADDVVAISGFGIFMGITFASDDSPLHMLILHGPIEVLIGVSFGLTWGILAQWIPNKEHHNVIFFRWLILLSGGLIAIFGSHLIHYEGAGGLATIVLAFVAVVVWRREQGWGDHNPVMRLLKKMWIILEPVIFALIGTEIQVDKIDPGTLGYGILVLLLALVCRMVGTYFAVTCGSLNFKEKLFMTFAWLPKATVQAALGPVFLSRAKSLVSPDPDMVGYGDQILTMAVLSILITAPLGSICIMGLGPKLLEKSSNVVVEPILDAGVDDERDDNVLGGVGGNPQGVQRADPEMRPDSRA